MSQSSKQPKRPPNNAEPCDSRGETWWLSELNPTLRDQFSRPIRARARQSLIDDKEAMTREEYDEAKGDLQDRIDAGAYSWGPPLSAGGTGAGRSIRAILDTQEGQIQLVQLLLSETHGMLPLDRVVEIMNGNPDGMQAALRAASGLPPLPPPEPEIGTGETTETTETKLQAPPAEARAATA